MDWNILVGFGTLALAIATFVAVHQGRRQIELIKDQISLQKAQLKPYIFIKNTIFVNNNTILSIENGENAIYALGLDTRCFIINDQYYDKQNNGKRITGNEAFQLHKQGKIVYAKPIFLEENKYPRLLHKGREIKIIDAVTFFTPQGISKCFPANKTYDVETTPCFILKVVNSDTHEQYNLEFDEFIDFLLLNKIPKVAVTMNLVFKDIEGRTKGQYYVANFIINTSEDKCLEDSSKNSYRFEQLPIDILNGDLKGVAFTRNEYENMIFP